MNNTDDTRRQQRLRDSRLIDNGLMDAFFEGNKEAAELLLKIILNRDDIAVVDVKTEHYLKNLHGRSVRLDIDVRETSGKRFNVEFQRNERGADPKRARYHSAMVDSHMLKPGEYYDKLRDSYVIFVTENDTLGSGKALNQIERINLDTGKQFNDGEHIIYVNGADRNSATALGRLMHDLYCSDPDEMFYEVLADKMRYFKNDERGIKKVNEYYDKWDLETIENEKTEIALNLIRMGKISFDDIAKATGLSVDKVTELATKRAEAM